MPACLSPESPSQSKPKQRETVPRGNYLDVPLLPHLSASIKHSLRAWLTVQGAVRSSRRELTAGHFETLPRVGRAGPEVSREETPLEFSL